MEIFGALIAVIAASSAAAPPGVCSQIDKELLVCPAPQAPRVTELRAGKVTLELRLALDGSVISSTVLSSSGDPRWLAAAQAAAATWHYSPNSRSRTRVVPFDFQTSAAQPSNNSFKVTPDGAPQLNR
jgi:TonB family protein